jgi:hypothetical protein
MLNLILGALAAAGLFLLINYTRQKKMKLGWWQWSLTILVLLYTVFVFEVIAGFLTEGATQAALVMGLITGILAVIAWVLLARFALRKA